MVPNSGHSQLLHRSMWLVAGSLALHPLVELASCLLTEKMTKSIYFSLAGVVGLISVFVHTRDARYKEQIVTVGHIRGNSSYSQEPRFHLCTHFSICPPTISSATNTTPSPTASLDNALVSSTAPSLMPCATCTLLSNDENVAEGDADRAAREGETDERR